MQSVKSTLVCLLIICSGINTLQGQQEIKANILFDFNSSELTNESKTKLENIKTQLESIYDFKIELSGHTDVHGSNDYNIYLSKKRVNAVSDYLIKQNIQKDNIEFGWFGETMLLDSKSSTKSDQLNRRVEVLVKVYKYESLSELKDILSRDKQQHFHINYDEDVKIATEGGVHYHIAANSFEYEDGSSDIIDQVEIVCTDAFDNMAYFNNDLSTVTPDNKLIETGGMVKIEAFANGKKLKLKDNSQIQVVYPLSEVKTDMELFYANTDTPSDELVDWVSTNQRFPVTSARKYDLGEVDWNILNMMDSMLQPERPYLHFDPMPKRPKKMSKPQAPSKPKKPKKEDITVNYEGLGKLFKSEKKKEKEIEEKYQQLLETYEKRMVRYDRAYEKYIAALEHYENNYEKRREDISHWEKELNKRLGIIHKYKNDMCRFHVEAQTKGLVRSLQKKKDVRTPQEIAKYIESFTQARVNLRVNDRELYIKAFENYTRDVLRKKEIYPTVADFSIYENKDFIPNMNYYLTQFRNMNIEENFRKTGKLDSKDLKSYTSSINKLGWINCDRFRNYPEEILANIQLPKEKTDEELEYWLIFNDIASMIKAKKSEDGYTILGVPQGENVKLVAIKIQDQRPSIAVQNFTIQRSNYLDLEFRNTTLGEIKSELNSVTEEELGD